LVGSSTSSSQNRKSSGGIASLTKSQIFKKSISLSRRNSESKNRKTWTVPELKYLIKYALKYRHQYPLGSEKMSEAILVDPSFKGKKIFLIFVISFIFSSWSYYCMSNIETIAKN
jgi:hypothetical protein